jgi:ribonuclease HII
MQNYKNSPDEIALDEAGRGPYFGPVYAAAVIWGNAASCSLVNDSKKLSAKKRKAAREWILANVAKYAIASASVDEIAEFNILGATRLAMQRAADAVNATAPLVIDGIRWENKFGKRHVESVVKGDAKYCNIAAASILAKEARDAHILEMCQKDPSLDEKYAISKNKGYGTKRHREGIKEHGLTENHRKSFKI